MPIDPRSLERITDTERATRITNDIKKIECLSEQEYQVLLLDIEKHKIKAVNPHEENIEETSEGVALSLVEMNATIKQMEHAAKAAESFMDKLGPVGFFIANGIELLATPWQCYKEKRWPTRDEWIKLSLCAGTIACIGISLAFPVIGAWFVIAATTAALVKGVQNIRMKKEELRRAGHLAFYTHNKIEALTDEIDALKNELNLSDEQKNTLSDKAKELTALTDQYVQEGHDIHGLREELHHPVKSQLHRVNVAMSAVALIGVVVSVFFPPLGVGLLIGAGLISLTTTVATPILKWFANRHDKSPKASVTPPPTDNSNAHIAETNEGNHPEKTITNHDAHSALAKPNPEPTIDLNTSQITPKTGETLGPNQPNVNLSHLNPNSSNDLRTEIRLQHHSTTKLEPVRTEKNETNPVLQAITEKERVVIGEDLRLKKELLSLKKKEPTDEDQENEENNNGEGI